MRLDKYIQKRASCGKGHARKMIARGDVCVEGKEIRDNLHEVHPLDHVELSGEVGFGASHQGRKYIMLHKPAGCVSATSDPEHRTVIDLITENYAGSLHIAGRLDKESTGLLILTNDGRWSRRITQPEESVPKTYLVKTENVISEQAVASFREGFYFAYEDLTTMPAELEILGDKEALVTIYEGRYHQVKRMFIAVENRVLALHRVSVGGLQLGDLALGEYRELEADEVSIF